MGCPASCPPCEGTGPAKPQKRLDCRLRGNDKVSAVVQLANQSSIDGERGALVEWCGDWEQFSYPVTSGRHTFTWTYVKNYTTAERADAAWIDDVEFPIW